MKNKTNYDPLMKLLSLLNAKIFVDDIGIIHISLDINEYNKYKKVWEMISNAKEEK